MFLSDLSIKRPVFAAVMMLVLVTLGIFSYRRLSIDMYPDVEIPVISIVTKFPGASPETVEREITKRIEEEVNRIPGVRHIVSTSRESVSNVVAIFQLEVKINEAVQDARAKINTIRGDMPKGMDDPIIQKLDFSAMPVVSLAIRSDGLSPRELTTIVEKKVKRRFENIAGVGKVELVGEAKREVNVVIDPIRLEALGIGIDEVIAGLSSENVNTPLGRVQRGGSEYALRISGKPSEVSRFKNMVIAARNGRSIPLGEIADIKDGIEEERTTALVNGTRAVSLDIIKQSGANTVGVVESVKEVIEKVQAELPPGIKIEIVRDGSIMIRDSVRDVEETMIIGGILTILIVFCFLNSWRSTVITGLTLPISVISSFTVMNFMGMTLNVLTLMALSLAIGLLIDDAIVVRENIVRHLEKGEDHFTAARNGTAEIGLAGMATTFSIMAVFVPVAYMKGIVGRFFFQFGITVAFAVLISLFVSFTLDPMLSSRWFDPDIQRQGKRNPLARTLDYFNDWFDRAAERYRSMIAWALDHRNITIFLAILAFIGGIAVFFNLQSTFFPEADNAELQIVFKSAPDASINETGGRLESVLAMLKSIPEIRHTYATIGAGDTGTVRDATVYVKLSEKAERKRSQKDIQQVIRRGLQEIPGIIPSIMEVGRLDNQKPLQINIRGDNIDLLKRYAADLKQRIQGIRGIADMEVTMEHDIPEFRFTVNRELAASTGVMTGDIVRTVGALVGGQVVSTYEDEDGDAVNLRVRLPLALRQEPEQIGRLKHTVRSLDGSPVLVPLSSLISCQRSATPAEINR
jgi:HAE1 family hydrophobic/amphiphilic exporter-1